jgi:nicotinamide riboside transporter PnuC
MSGYKELSKVKFTAWTIALIMIVRWMLIFGGILFKNKNDVAATLVDSIAILIFVGLIMPGIRQIDVKQKAAPTDTHYTT